MKRRLIFIACVFVATILFFVVQRGVWLLYYHAQSGMFGAGDILRTFVFGLRLDASTAGYVTSVPLLAMLAGACADLGRRGGRIVRRIVMAWLVFVSLFVSWIFTADAVCTNTGRLASTLRYSSTRQPRCWPALR